MEVCIMKQILEQSPIYYLSCITDFAVIITMNLDCKFLFGSTKNKF